MITQAGEHSKKKRTKQKKKTKKNKKNLRPRLQRHKEDKAENSLLFYF